MNELCHYGVKGMKWGVRKTEYSRNKKSKPKKEKENPSSKKDTDAKRRKDIRKSGTIAFASKAASKALYAIGKKQYDKYKDNASPERAAAIKGMGYASKALNVIGDTAFTLNAVQRYRYESDYWDIFNGIRRW